MLRIGISACFFPADPQRAVFKGKTLLYMVQPMSDWLQSEGVLTYLIPTLPSNGAVKIQDVVKDFDGLVLEGGSDVSPKSYGETPLKPEWAGDFSRDQYETALIKEFRALRKPVLAICRGLQILNVALGGTLYQDIQTQIPDAMNHRNWDIYDQNFHDIEIETDSYLARIYDGVKKVTVNSVHHQAIKDLAPGLKIDARAIPDGVIEAIHMPGEDYLVGVQWHPEFQSSVDSRPLLSTPPLLKDFLAKVKGRKSC